MREIQRLVQFDAFYSVSAARSMTDINGFAACSGSFGVEASVSFSFREGKYRRGLFVKGHAATFPQKLCYGTSPEQTSSFSR